MMIMPAQNSHGMVHFYAGKYPGKIGWLMSPFSFRRPPEYMPYAIDNGAFTKWEPDKFMRILGLTTFYHRPLWVLVPDVVGDCEATLKLWHDWKDICSPFGPLAFAAQDGMSPQDVPKEAHCVFVGGTTEFKLSKAQDFKGIANLLHVGRVNTPGRLWWADAIGADSVDGTGFFRGDQKQLKAFMEFFDGSKQTSLNW